MNPTHSQNLAEAVGGLLKTFRVPSNIPAIAQGTDWRNGNGTRFEVRSPINGEILAEFKAAMASDVSEIASGARRAFLEWQVVPAPRRGELVRQIGERLRTAKPDLARLVSIECGKIYQEALGEVQEMIDICEFAVGLSRQLHGLTIASERPGHRMMEQWHPLGPIGVISAFNFPVAVWSWNAMLALVCGDPVIWKPSEKTPLCALACHALASQTVAEFRAPRELLQLILGGTDVGQAIAANPKLPLISATGSTRMGRSVGTVVAQRFGKGLLELGGNNAAIVAPSADLQLVLRAVLFSAFGTCGQRCTTLRRLIIHESLFETLLAKLTAAVEQLRIGDPLRPETLIGPLIDQTAFENMQNTLREAEAAGAEVIGGSRLEIVGLEGGYYVRPAIVRVAKSLEVMQRETFAPILFCQPYRLLNEAIELQNGVPQGLSSSIFTTDVREAELFCSPMGSDCGIANVNIGTSGAEIGGAFGGEKETGGGRESGSDSWKAYMRRVTNTINYSRDLPLAQGIRFDL